MDDVQLTETMRVPVVDETRTWDMYDVDENYYAFNQFYGKPIVLDFWATWCAPCRAELPEVEEMKEHFSDRIHVVAVSTESIDAIKDSGLHDDYDFLYSTQQYPPIFGVEVFPTIVILNSEMEMVYKHAGAGGLNTEANYQFIEKLIKKT